MLEKSAQKLLRLTERYYGKRDILATWDEMKPGDDLKYRNDLKRRVLGHKNDLLYRGAEPE